MTDAVCYFIQTHRDPEQIYRLVRTLRRGSNPRSLVVVQHNPSGFELDWSPVADLPNVYLMPPCAFQLRSHYSCQVQPFVDLIDWLEREKHAYDLWLTNDTRRAAPLRITAQLDPPSGSVLVEPDAVLLEPGARATVAVRAKPSGGDTKERVRR